MVLTVFSIPPSHLRCTVVIVFADDAAGENVFGHFFNDIKQFQLFGEVGMDGNVNRPSKNERTRAKLCDLVRAMGTCSHCRA